MDEEDGDMANIFREAILTSPINYGTKNVFHMLVTCGDEETASSLN